MRYKFVVIGLGCCLRCPVSSLLLIMSREKMPFKSGKEFASGQWEN